MNRLPTIRVAALVLASALTGWAALRAQQPKTDPEAPATQPAAPKAPADKPKEPIDTEAAPGQPAAPKAAPEKPKELIDTENPGGQQPAAPKTAAAKPKELIDTEAAPGQPAEPKTAPEKKELIDTENPASSAHAPATAGASPSADALLKAFASYNAQPAAPGGDPARQIDAEIKQLGDLTAFRYRLAAAAAQLRGRGANGRDLAALKAHLHGEVEQARSQARQAAKELQALRDGAGRAPGAKPAAAAAQGEPAGTND